MKKCFRWAAVIVSLLSTMVVNAEPSITLKEIVEKTIVSNPEVQANFHSYKASVQDQKSAKGAYYPRLDITSNLRNQESVTSNINNTENPDSQTQLILRQMLFDGFATRSEVKRLGHAARVRYYELQSSIQTIALEMVSTYVDIKRYRELVSFAKENYIVHKLLFDRIEERVTAGVARRVDLEQASGRLALAEANLLTEITNLQNVSTRYQRLSGELPTGGLAEIDFYTAGVQETANEALALAYIQNPTLLSAIENIIATEQEVEGKRAKYMPRVDLQGRKNLDVSSNGRNSSQAADLIELTATFNLFNGFTDQAEIAKSSENLNRSHDLRDKACVDTRQTLVIAYNDVISLKEQLDYRSRHKTSIKKAREAYRKQFDIGQRTLLDLLDTENEYFQAKRAYTNTQRDLHTAYARTYASEGDLLNKLDVVRADLPDLGDVDYTKNYSVCQAVSPDMIHVDKASLIEGQSLGIANDKKFSKKETPEKIILTDKVVPDVQFETNSAIIKPVSFSALDNAVKTLNDWGGADVEIAGHTDKRNTSKAAYNQKLSERRAQAVSDYLIKKGIDANRLTVKGYGFDVPVAENDPIKGNSSNRRVELIRQK